MARPDCDICCGRGTISLHVRARGVARMLEPIETLQPTIVTQREYSCPECSGVTGEKLVIVEAEATVDTRVKEQHASYADYVRGSLAAQIADKMHRQNLITFHEQPPPHGITFGIVGRIAVASKHALATLEQRIAEREPDIAREVADEAVRQVDNWGSHYGRSDILKRDATQMIREAVKIVLLRRAERRKSA